MLKKRGRKGPQKQNFEDQTRVNEAIKVPEVMVITPDGEQAGVLAVYKAIAMAKEYGLDLVEVAPTAKPPVCRIMNYGKFRFEQAKKDKVAKKKQTIVKVKEIKLHPKTADNDYTYRMKQAIGFLEKGYKVKVTMFFRGREMAHQEFGKKLLTRAKEDLVDYAEVELESKMEGNNMTSIFNPIKQIKKPIKEKEQKPQADLENQKQENVAPKAIN